MANNILLYNAALSGYVAGALAGRFETQAIPTHYSEIVAQGTVFAGELDSAIANDTSISAADGTALTGAGTSALVEGQSAKPNTIYTLCFGAAFQRYATVLPASAFADTVGGIVAIYTESVAPSTERWNTSAHIQSRTGFASTLPEFFGITLPENTYSVDTSFQLTDRFTNSWSYVDDTGLSATLVGGYSGNSLTLNGTVADWTIAVAGTLISSLIVGTVTITRTSTGTSEVRDFTAANGGAVPLRTGYWLDGVAGNDANDGLSVATPKKTFAAFPPLVNGDKFYGARGTNMREMVDATGLVVTIGAYGIGPRPIANAFDVITGWVLVSGTTYSATWTPAYDPVTKGSMLLLDLGKPILLVADLATCEATLGSSVIQSTTGAGSYTIFVNLSDGSNPNNRTIEVNIRETGVKCAGSSTLFSWMTRGCVSDDGTTLDYQTSQLGIIETPSVDDWVATNGTRHDMLVCGGTVSNSAFISVSPKPDGAGGVVSVSSFVANRHTINAADTFKMINCGFMDYASHAASTIAIYGFTTCVDTHPSATGLLATATFDQCGCSYYPFGSASAAVSNLTDCLFENKRAPNTGDAQWLVVGGNSTNMDRCRYYGHNAGDVFGRLISGDGNNDVNQCLITVGTGVGFSFFTSVRTTIRNTTIIAIDTIGYRAYNAAAADSLTFNNNVVQGANRSITCDNSSNASYVVGGFNVMDPVSKVKGAFTEVEVGGFVPWVTSAYAIANNLDQNSSDAVPDWGGTDAGARPTYQQTAASIAAFGFTAGAQGVQWVTPSVYNDWITICAGL